MYDIMAARPVTRKAAAANRVAETKSGDDVRALLQERLDELQAVAREDRPDLEMLSDMRDEVQSMIDAGIDDADLATVADGIIREIDNLVMRTEALAEMRDAVANDKSTTTPIEVKLLASNVTAVAAGTRRFRAVVQRSISQTAVVEFDAPEGADRWTLGDELIRSIPEDAWASSDPSGGYVQDMQLID